MREVGRECKVAHLLFQASEEYGFSIGLPFLLAGIACLCACPVLFLPPLARQFRTSRNKLVREPSEVAEVALEGALDMDTTG